MKNKCISCKEIVSIKIKIRYRHLFIKNLMILEVHSLNFKLRKKHLILNLINAKIKKINGNRCWKRINRILKQLIPNSKNKLVYKIERS